MSEAISYDGAKIILTLKGVDQAEYKFVSDAKYKAGVAHEQGHFSVKNDGDVCILKGNGFDGIALGRDRDEAERFINFVNSFISLAKQAKPSDI